MNIVAFNYFSVQVPNLFAVHNYLNTAHSLVNDILPATLTCTLTIMAVMIYVLKLWSSILEATAQQHFQYPVCKLTFSYLVGSISIFFKTLFSGSLEKSGHD